MENISTSVTKWKNQLQSGLAQNHEREELEVSNPDWHLEFAGYVSQQYTAKRDSTGSRRPVKAYEELMSRIPEEVERNFIASAPPGNLKSANFALGTIPNFHSLIPMSQNSRKPIFELRGADGVVGAHFQKVKEYEEIISGIADSLVYNMNELVS